MKGATVSPNPRPVLNLVNGSNDRGNSSDNLFSTNNLDQNVVNSIDGATALKLDENYEIKSIHEQNATIDSFESIEENKILKDATSNKNISDEIPDGVSIESASYMENNNDQANDHFSDQERNLEKPTNEKSHTPKLFSEEPMQENQENKDYEHDHRSNELFDQDTDEDEDFEIPAFLRRQKF